MGSFDGAEICELIRIYLLEKLSPILGKENFGLYRDDALVLDNSTIGAVLERMRKDIISIFKNECLFYYIRNKSHPSTLFGCYIQPINRKLFPIQKVNNKPLYTNTKSNHAYTIIK